MNCYIINILIINIGFIMTEINPDNYTLVANGQMVYGRN